MYDYIARSAFPIPGEVRDFVDAYQQGWSPPSYP